ncbi:MAG: hypothetical protein KJ061_05100 [Vicinamibacteraceae bacterium]|nr:hypothetical protein [Vicinamibacteraceae bacterium]
MLRITPQRDAARLVFKLEGHLAGPWVAEVADCWRAAIAAGEPHIWVDLSGVCHVDLAGRRLLGHMHRSGVGFVTQGCEMRELLREVSGLGAPADRAGRDMGDRTGRDTGHRADGDTGNRTGRDAGNRTGRDAAARESRDAATRDSREAANRNSREAANRNGRGYARWWVH